MLAINSAFVPIFFKLYDKNKQLNQYEEIYNIVNKLIFVSGIIEIFLLLLYPTFYLFIDEKYSYSLSVVPYLILSNILLSIYFINTNTLSTSVELNRKKIYGVLLGITSNLLFSLILIKYIGMIGVAIGTLIGFFVSTLYFIRIVKKHTLFRYNNFLFILYFLLIFIICQFTEILLVKIIFLLILLIIFYRLLFFERVKYV